jgi:hypothetical protein
MTLEKISEDALKIPKYLRNCTDLSGFRKISIKNI